MKIKYVYILAFLLLFSCSALKEDASPYSHYFIFIEHLNSSETSKAISALSERNKYDLGDDYSYENFKSKLTEDDL